MQLQFEKKTASANASLTQLLSQLRIQRRSPFRLLDILNLQGAFQIFQGFNTEIFHLIFLPPSASWASKSGQAGREGRRSIKRIPRPSPRDISRHAGPATANNHATAQVDNLRPGICTVQYRVGFGATAPQA